MIKDRMSDIRKGEIALAVLKYRIRKDGIHLGPNSKRELGNLSKEMMVPIDELKEFGRIFIGEFLKETLSE